VDPDVFQTSSKTAVCVSVNRGSISANGVDLSPVYLLVCRSVGSVGSVGLLSMCPESVLWLIGSGCCLGW